MDFREKLIRIEEAARWRDRMAREGRRVVATNGCFDILHLGHALYLQAARALGDCLLVGVNSDDSVRRIKGPGRPINPEADRAGLVAALGCVDAVTIFSEPNALRLIELVRPDVYVKGGDYTIDTINQEERRLAERLGGEARVLPGIEGRSTSEIIRRAIAAFSPPGEGPARRP